MVDRIEDMKDDPIQYSCSELVQTLLKILLNLAALIRYIFHTKTIWHCIAGVQQKPVLLAISWPYMSTDNKRSFACRLGGIPFAQSMDGFFHSDLSVNSVWVQDLLIGPLLILAGCTHASSREEISLKQ